MRRLSEDLRRVLVKLGAAEAEAAETEVWLDPAKSVELVQRPNAKLSAVGQDATLSYGFPGTCTVFIIPVGKDGVQYEEGERPEMLTWGSTAPAIALDGRHSRQPPPS